ncbi:MAG TPA: YqaE/Pmp3 family membrane protein [Cryomorphaceae bacterium]|nr:YqaE/Pmp3 family membrane protein [Cryomorphaceae bacterium]
MKRFSILSLLIAILATSCQTSSELGSNALIQKRRYTKGYNLNIKKPVITKDSQKQNDTNDPILAELRNTNLLDGTHHSMPELQTKDATVRKLASEELSKSLLNNNEKEVEKNETDANVAPPKSVVEAFPFAMKNRRSHTSGNAMPAAAVSDEEILLIIILTILLPPLGVGLVFGISKEFWISLLLTIIFYFPGLIYSLIVILKS